jgi:hypothetical protein
MTPEEQEINRKQEEIQHLEQNLADVDAQYADFCMDLKRFEDDYLREVSPIYDRLDRWQLRIACSQMMLERLREVRDGLQPPPEDPFSWSALCVDQARQQWAHDQAEKFLRQEELNTDNHPESESIENIQSTKQIYRELARRFHPDLVETEEAQTERTRLMSRINEAYQHRDLKKLKEFLNHPEITDPQIETVGDTLIRLIRRVAQLRGLIKEAQNRLHEEQNSELVQLFKQCQDSMNRTGNPFDVLKQALQDQIDRAKFEWMCQRARESKLWTEIEP